MATRFYLSDKADVSISPAYSSDWERTSAATRRWMSTVKQNTSIAQYQDSESVTSQPYDVLIRQYVSEPIAAQTISGTIKGQIRTLESNSAADFCRALVAKVVSGDGGTVRGVLLSDFPSSLTSEFATSTATNRYFPPETSVNSVEAQSGDRIVIEIGFRSFNTSSTLYAGYFRFGDNASSDLPVDETSTNDYNPWIEFSADITFLDQIQVSQVLVQFEYVPASGPVEDGEVSFALSPESSSEVVVYEGDGSATIEISPSSEIVIDIAVDGNVTCGLEPASEIEMFSTILDGEVEFSFIPESEAYVDTTVVEGSVEIKLEPSSESYVTLIVVEGTCNIEFAVSSTYAGSYLVDGQVNIVFGVTSEVYRDVIVDGRVGIGFTVERLEVDHELSGGLDIGGESDVEILGPDIYQIEFAGGLFVEGLFEYDLPSAETYSHECSGVIVVTGAFAYKSFDPATLTPADKVLSGGVAIGGSITGEAQYTAADDLTVSLTLSGGVTVGELRLPPIKTSAPQESEDEILTRTLKGGVRVRISLEIEKSEETVYEHSPRFGGVKVGGACVFMSIMPPTFMLEVTGGVNVGGSVIEDDEDLVETWVMSGFAFSPSFYSNFPFNSYCLYRGQAYAAGPEGIYRLEGEDDNGEPIHSGLRIGPTSFGIDNLKRLRGVYPGNAGEPELRVEGVQYREEGFYTLGRGNRFDVDREVQDRVFIIDFQDFDEMSQVEIMVMPLMRR